MHKAGVRRFVKLQTKTTNRTELHDTKSCFYPLVKCLVSKENMTTYKLN